MNEGLPVILLGGLTLICLMCVLGIVYDLRTGTSRLAHESHDVRRHELPLNFWLGVGSKAAGAATALILGVLVVQHLM